MFLNIFLVYCVSILNIILKTYIVSPLMQLYSFQVLHIKEHLRIKRVLC